MHLPMASPQTHNGGATHALVLGTLAGVALGAGGLAVFLLGRAQDRRNGLAGRALPRLTRLQEAIGTTAANVMGQRSDRALEEKVHQLNRAIDDVRRQLEQLQPQA
jgi:phage shock protein A